MARKFTAKLTAAGEVTARTARCIIEAGLYIPVGVELTPDTCIAMLVDKTGRRLFIVPEPFQMVEGSGGWLDTRWRPANPGETLTFGVEEDNA